MIERQHVHTWVAVDEVNLGKELVRRDEACDCGATRVRIGYRWERRRDIWARRS